MDHSHPTVVDETASIRTLFLIGGNIFGAKEGSRVAGWIQALRFRIDRS